MQASLARSNWNTARQIPSAPATRHMSHVTRQDVTYGANYMTRSQGSTHTGHGREGLRVQQPHRQWQSYHL